ncbi:5924_t:CDS:2 [Ambispora gerdemannii]|uniref:5924_t:CDS:1 n=1 Tax=Ambispora gerdemannii TaxID=144530 RepID=A0A9N8YNA7_9GLOM|nr:5924_t:CDS:2 [Ambispora gerdemannii]
MDNASFHRAPEKRKELGLPSVEEQLSLKNSQLFSLPARSPQLNPVELIINPVNALVEISNPLEPTTSSSNFLETARNLPTSSKIAISATVGLIVICLLSAVCYGCYRPRRRRIVVRRNEEIELAYRISPPSPPYRREERIDFVPLETVEPTETFEEPATTNSTTASTE